MGPSRRTLAYAMIGFAALLASSCAGDPIPSTDWDNESLPASSESSPVMPKELRAAYIASVQNDASESYAAKAIDNVVRLENHAQRFVATVNGDGISVAPNKESWHWAMRTVSMGCAGAMLPVTDASFEPQGNRVEVRRDELEEWYVNGPLGVEQGFVLREAPPCTGLKTITLAVDGDIAATLDDTDGDGRGEALRFFDADGREKLSYSDLLVKDATGKTLPAWLSMSGDDIAIVVDDVGAAYPLAIDPLIWVEQQKLLASDGATGDYFGAAVSLSGDTALVGAFNDDDQGANSGAAYVFVRNGGVWTQQAKLVASDGAMDDNFGISVSMSGDTAVVGAFGDDDQGAGSGSAYVFVRNGGVWTEETKLVGSDVVTFDSFGYSVSLLGETALVGAPYGDGAATDSGSVYAFVRNGGVWTEQAKLVASDGGVFDDFGISVSLSGDTVLIGADGDDDTGSDAGSAYVFVRNGTVWTQQAKLMAADGAMDDYLGWSVSLSGDTALAGAYGDDHNGIDTGSAYIFVRNGAAWTQQAKVIAADGAAGDVFGVTVSISGDTALVGAVFDDDKGVNSGSAYIFARNGATWTQQTKLVASDGAQTDWFTYSISLSGDTALIGARYDDDLGVDSGSVYALVLRQAGGGMCAANTECASGFCTDGVCCDSACGNGDSTDCQACSVATGAAIDGTCGPAAMSTVCRASLGTCDAIETCDGVAMVCPGDTKIAAGTECRASAGMCDIAETCDGAANDCPTDTKIAVGTECRASAGMCDIAETCDGAANDCPADTKIAVGTECRAAAGTCDIAETCDGAANDCPADTKIAVGTECRAAAGTCDIAESCDGAANDCPADTKIAAGTECRAAAGTCDIAESCDGAANDCPTDTKITVGTECRPAAGACDIVESCDGIGADCPSDTKVAAGTECRKVAGTCDVAESCDGIAVDCPSDAKIAAGTECRLSAGTCDIAESCNGAENDCPVDTKVAAGTQCRPSITTCDIAESCDGATNDCPDDLNAPDGTSCPEGTCTKGECLMGQGGSGGAAGSGGAGGAGGGEIGGAGGAGGGEIGGAGGSGGDELPLGGGCTCDIGGASASTTSNATFFLMAFAFAMARRRGASADSKPTK